MPTSTVRPNETLSGASLYTISGGSATVHAALSDTNNATFVQKTGTGVASLVVGSGTISLTSSQIVRQVRARATVAGATAASKSNIYLGTIGSTGASSYGAALAATRGVLTATTVSGPWYGTTPDGELWSQAKIDAVRVQFVEYKNTSDRSTLYEVFVDIDVTTKPTVSVSGPTGTITTTAKPDVSWTYSDTDGDGQTSYQIKVFTAAQYGAGGFDPSISSASYDSGEVANSDTTATVADYLAASGAHRAYVRVGKTINGVTFWSDWAFSAFTMSLTAPTTPTLSATYDSNLNRVALSMTGSATAGSDYQAFDVERSDDGGTTYSLIRNGEGLLMGGSFTSTILDYEAPRDITARYRVRTIAYTGSNVAVSSYSSAATAAITNDGLWWVKSTDSPSLNYGGVRVLEGVGVAVEENLGVFRAIGRSEPIVVSGTIGGQDGSYTILTLGVAEWDSIYALATHQGTLLIQDPFGQQKYVRAVSRNWKQTGATTAPRREVNVGYVEVSNE
jgi:hypothetical protein